MDYVAGKGLLRLGTRAQLATNRLLLVGPAGSRARLAIAPGFPLAAALGIERLAIADPHICAGRPLWKGSVGYVFQDGRLFPHLRVCDNLLYGWKLAPGDRRIGMEDAAQFLGIGHLLDRWPRTLSGGEAQ